jgi:hypothetical protein
MSTQLRKFPGLLGLFLPKPYTAAQLKASEQTRIEQCAGVVVQQIAKCETREHLLDVIEDAFYFASLWPTSVQAQAWSDSLILEIWGKHREISAKVGFAA